jgi:hypothetical protein
MTEKITLAALVSLRRRPPNTAFLSLVEASSFLAFGGFLRPDDLEALFKSELDHGEESEDPNGDIVDDWSRASRAILAEAGLGEVTLLGRSAPWFGADPEGELVPIPVEFFAAERNLVLGLTDTLYVNNDPNRIMYYEVKVGTDRFVSVFPTAKPARPATANERQAIRAYAEKVFAETDRAPSAGELSDEFPQVSRSSLRATIKELPPHLRREVGH